METVASRKLQLSARIGQIPGECLHESATLRSGMITSSHQWNKKITAVHFSE